MPPSVNRNAHDNRRRRFHTVWEIELLKDLNRAMEALKREVRTLSRSFLNLSTQVNNALELNNHGGADNIQGGGGVDNIEGGCACNV
ncbi:hypothetical protein KY289_036383 [Solanum tuberosum]|nr:hypothetical protein KY289_036383 [Solanum tuberosum]